MKVLRKLLGRAILLTFGIVIPILILEAGVRIMGLAPPAEPQPALWTPHPYLGWFHVPNSGGLSFSEYGEYQAPVHINARGLRDQEIGYDNPTGAFRILVLGDSFAEALQVPLEETFVKRLEDSLNINDQPTQVINAGVGGWGTDQEATFYMIEGFRYQPNLVLLCFFPHNDILNNYMPLEVARVHGAVEKPFFQVQDGELILPEFPFEPVPAAGSSPTRLLVVGNWLIDHSSLYRLIAPYLREIPFLTHTLGSTGLLGGMTAFMAEDSGIPLSYFVYQSTPSPEWEEAWQVTEALFKRLNSEVQADGAQLAVVIIGAPEQVYADRWATILARTPEMQQYTWDLDAPNRRLATILDEAGIPYLDLLPVFRSASEQPGAPIYHYRRDGHWTPEGHILASQKIADFLLQNGLTER